MPASSGFPVGDLDTRFGTGGKATFNLAASDDEARAVVNLPGGDFAVVGRSFNGDFDVSIARYNANGTLQTSSTSDGLSYHRRGFRLRDANGSFIKYSDDTPLAAAVLADGSIRIVGTGEAYSRERDASADSLFLMTVQPDNSNSVRWIGRGDGYPRTAYVDPATGSAYVVLERDDVSRLQCYTVSNALCPGFTSAGTVFLSGEVDVLARARSGGFFALETDADDHAPVIVRVTDQGARVGSFGINGAVELKLPGFRGGGLIAAMELADGRVLVSGGSYNSTGAGTAFVARLLPNGSLDASFGSNGYAVSSSLYATSFVSEAGDGAVLAAGLGLSGASSETYSLATFRISASGAVGTPTLVAAPDFDFEVFPAVALRADGSFLMATPEFSDAFQRELYAGDFVTRRFRADGTYDTAFGVDGKVVTNFGGGAQGINDLVIGPDGTTYALGYGASRYGDEDNRYYAVVLKMRPDGSLDPSYGIEGRALAYVYSGYSVANMGGFALQPDGGTVVAGYAYDRGMPRCAVTGLDPQGRHTWGAYFNFTDYAYCYNIARQADGKILVAGGFGSSAGVKMGVARLTAEGSMDVTFGTNGLATVSPAGANGFGYNVAVQVDGRILVSGVLRNGSEENDVAVARLTSTGALDPTFGTGGVFRLDVSGTSNYDALFGLGLRSDGRIVVTGEVYPTSTASRDIFVLGLTAAGALDPTYGTNGLTTLPGASEESANALVLQRDGRALVAGRTNSSAGYVMTVYRFTTAGALDPSFGPGGVVQVPFSGPVSAQSSTVYGLAQKPDGAILLGGAAFDGFGVAHSKTTTVFAQLVGDTPTPAETVADPDALALSAPAPNPARGAVRVRYTLPTPGPVHLDVFDALGRHVATLAAGEQPSGAHTALLDASSLAPGVYLVRLSHDGNTRMQRLTVGR